MPIRAVKATKEGIRALENYDGENSDLPFLSATILARVQELTVTRDIYSFLNTEYPTAIAPLAISNAIGKLERLGYATVFREVTLANKIVVTIDGFSIPTTLGEFVNINLRHCPMPITEMCEKLSWHGTYEIKCATRLEDKKVTIKLV